MPCNPLRISRVAASCGSSPLRKRPAIANNAASSVMVTDSVAFCAKAENSGSTNRGLGAAHTRAGAISARTMRKLQFLMKAIPRLLLNARLIIGRRRRRRRRLALDHFVRQIQLLTGHAQRLDDLAPR